MPETFKSIKFKIFVLVTLVAAVLVAVTNLWVYRYLRASLVDEAGFQAGRLLGHISREMVIDGGWLPPRDLGRVIGFHTQLRTREKALMVFDAQAGPIFPPDPDQALVDKFSKFLGKDKTALTELGRDHLYAAVIPVHGPKGFLGSLVGILALGDLDRQVEMVGDAVLLLGLATWLLLSAALYGSLDWLVVRRIQRLGQASAALAQGRRQARALVSGRDEISHLAENFNQMADSLTQAIDQAEQEQHRLQVVLDSQNDGLFVVDTQRRITMANQQFCRMLGLEPEQIVGRPCGELVRSDLCRLGCPLFGEAGGETAPGQSRELESTLLLPSGGYLSIRKNAKLIRNSAGKVTGGVETVRDVSFEKELARLRAEWESFMRHELRTPLQPLLGFSRLLAQDPEALDPDKRRQYLELMHQSAEHLGRLLEMTREVQLYEAGRIPLNLMPYDLTATLEQAAAEAWAALHTAGEGVDPGRPDWRLEKEPGLNTVITADPVKLGRVFRNLLQNAWEHHPGTVRVSLTGSPAGFVSVAVHNQGEPIAPERLETIFEKFNTTKSGHGGTGLGTTIARLFTLAHGGTITVTSTREQGTRFTVHLPRGGPEGSPDGGSETERG